MTNWTDTSVPWLETLAGQRQTFMHIVGVIEMIVGWRF